MQHELDGEPGYVSLRSHSFPAQAGGSAPGTAAAAPGAAGGAASTSGGQPDYSAAWAEYYRHQAAYYGQTGQASGQPATPQQGQVGMETLRFSSWAHSF